MSKDSKIQKFSAYEGQPIPQPIEERMPAIQFVTSNELPNDEGVSMWFGSSVSARSIRLISLKTTERDNWWAELRQEITKNALSIGCTHIIGYRETVSIFSDVMILNVFGTAVKISEGKRKIVDKSYNRMRTPLEYSP